jgi:hypothetical protein
MTEHKGTCGTPSENIRLIINTLQAQELFSSKLSYNFPCFFAVTGKKLLILQPETDDSSPSPRSPCIGREPECNKVSLRREI